MVLLIHGKSRCPICGSVIESGDEIVGTTAFLKNSHPLSRFSDAAFHRLCFETCPERTEVERLYSKFEQKMATAPSSLEEYENWVNQAMLEFDAEES